MIQRLLGLAVLSCLWVLAFLFMPETAESQTCPGFAIEGFGKDTTGGCGGKIINVTNLNNSGAGSLRACLEASGTRICRPTVSGWVTLSDDIEIVNGNLTLDGSVAPNGGLGVRGESVRIRASTLFFDTSASEQAHVHPMILANTMRSPSMVPVPKYKI